MIAQFNTLVKVFLWMATVSLCLVDNTICSKASAFFLCHLGRSVNVGVLALARLLRCCLLLQYRQDNTFKVCFDSRPTSIKQMRILNNYNNDNDIIVIGLITRIVAFRTYCRN